MGIWEDDDQLMNYLKKRNIYNQIPEAKAVPLPASAYQPEDNRGFFSKAAGVAGPVMKIGGSVATMLGQPEIGVPLSIAGGGVSGASSGGVMGGLKGLGTSGASAALSAGMGAGIDAMKSPINDPIDMASKGITVPGQRVNPIDMGNMTVPASPKALFGGGS